MTALPNGIDYTPPPTLSAFMESDAFGRICAGPVGSGKTTACVMELLRRSIAQNPAEDGYRYTRWAIVRKTLKQLKDTVLKEMQAWLGPPLGGWREARNTYLLEFADVKSEMIYIPLESDEDQARLLSMQLTGCWLSELIEMERSIIAPVSGRIGRYPSGNRGVATWCGIITDTNMPTEMTDWHDFFTNLPPSWQLFRQPSGLAAEAENLNWLFQTEATRALPVEHPQRLAQGRKYYENLVRDNGGSASDWVKRYVYAEYGDDPSGEAVFRATFNPKFHVVDETLVIPGYPLIVAQDFGRNPWTLICQCDHMGRLLVHDEIAATNVGLEMHLTEQVRPRLGSNKYAGCRVFVVGDPAGVAKGTVAEESCFDALGRLGFAAFPAPSNLIEPRLRAVEALLGRQVGGGPALMISRKGCPVLVRAMSGGYRFTKIADGGALRNIPDKKDKEGFNHVCDVLQYACLVVHGNLVGDFARRAVRMQQRRQHVSVPVSALGWT